MSTCLAEEFDLQMKHNRFLCLSAGHNLKYWPLLKFKFVIQSIKKKNTAEMKYCVKVKN